MELTGEPKDFPLNLGQNRVLRLELPSNHDLQVYSPSTRWAVPSGQ